MSLERTNKKREIMVKVQSRLVGFVNGGKWNKDTRKFEIGKFKAGDGFGLNLALSVSKKKDDSREYGASVPITMWLDNKEQFPQVEKLLAGMVVLEGYFSPNNYEKDGKTIKGMQFNCSFKDMSSADSYNGGSATESAPAVAEIDEQDVPF